MNCAFCPTEADEGTELCPACSIELAHRVMNAEPDPIYARCTVCGADFRFTEARVLRSAKDSRANLSAETPSLCWVCAHLHLSARDEVFPPYMVF